jgi:hypothetical protein
MNEEIKKEILTRLGLEDMDNDVQEGVLIDVGRAILNQVLLDAYDSLPSEKQIAFKIHSEKTDMTALTEFLSREIPDYEALVAGATARVLKDLV